MAGKEWAPRENKMHKMKKKSQHIGKYDCLFPPFFLGIKVYRGRDEKVGRVPRHTGHS